MLIADESDKTESDELSSHLHSLLPMAGVKSQNYSSAVTAAKQYFWTVVVTRPMIGCVRSVTSMRARPLETLGALCVRLVGVGRVEVSWGIVRLTMVWETVISSSIDLPRWRSFMQIG